MRRLLQRLAWRNLPIQGKVGLFFVLLLLLIALMSLSSLVALSVVRAQTRETVDTSLEMRSIAQDLRIDLDALQRLEQRTIDDVGSPLFTFDQVVARSQHAELISSLSANARRLEALAAQLPDTRTREQFSEQVALLQRELDASQSQYTESTDLIAELAQPNSGSLAVLNLRGRALEWLAALSGDAELIDLLASTRSTEQEYRFSQELLALGLLRGHAAAVLDYYSNRMASEHQSPELESALTEYLAQLDIVNEQLKVVYTVRQQNEYARDNMRDATDRLTRLTETLSEDSLNAIEETNRVANGVLLAGVIATAVLGAGVTALVSRGFNRSFGALLATTVELEEGNLSARAPVYGEDEFNQLARSFNAMATQLEGLISGLEQRVAERTRDLGIVAEISRAVVALRDPRDLMNEVVELVRDRFNFYHAQVFLIDTQGANAELIASTGSAGRELLARRHYLPVGSQSVIGQVTAYGEPVIALDTDTSAIHRRNELLLETRSEMALPMRIGDQVVGALDVQSTKPNAFSRDDVSVFQLMADQLAIGLENARLYTRYNVALEELQTLSRQQVAQSWQDYRMQRSNNPLSFSLAGDGVVEASRDELPAPLDAAIQHGKLVTVQGNGDEISLAVPIRVRGEVIGALGFGGETLGGLTDDDLALIQAVIERVGLALENRRLFEQTQRQAQREQIVNEITAKVVGSTDINHILRTTVQELGRVLRAPQTTVQLRGGGVLDE